jgi:hypothetical protein
VQAGFGLLALRARAAGSATGGAAVLDLGGSSAQLSFDAGAAGLACGSPWSGARGAVFARSAAGLGLIAAHDALVRHLHMRADAAAAAGAQSQQVVNPCLSFGANPYEWGETDDGDDGDAVVLLVVCDCKVTECWS